MKAILLTALALALAAHGQAPAAGSPVIQVDYANPGQSPSQWTMTLRPDGTGHFRSQMGKMLDSDPHAFNTPSVDRDIQVSAAFATRVFNVARHHNWFNEPCDGHLKVAFQGWKTLTYTGPQGHGACTFNYSKDKDIQSLGESAEAVSETILEGARLELLLQHDRLGLDSEMEFLTDAAGDGRAQEICTIRGILERLAQDDEVLDRVRKRARALLEHGTT
jgi:hypothetical protein